ncbi:hypothetical protein OPV22_000297 [Ensete ventricosum]|uniref:Uncharacterized protein n=1 Tax=Ensete ventricosum TaxID=4639 RepID=A0AAV8RV21_ENSVE|nr:hypothetical protein OPV22_000297 [Ensete ventricosum]
MDIGPIRPAFPGASQWLDANRVRKKPESRGDEFVEGASLPSNDCGVLSPISNSHLAPIYSGRLELGSRRRDTPELRWVAVGVELSYVRVRVLFCRLFWLMDHAVKRVE